MFGLQEIINNRNSFWKEKGPRNDIVLSTRIRLGRNAVYIPYPESMGDSDFEALQEILQCFINSSAMGGNTTCIKLNELDLHEKRLLLEKNIITIEMETSERCLVLINNIRDFTILVNDSDHFRIQVIRPGFQLYETYKDADSVDDALNSVVRYAFSDNYGYLTPDPANVGNGLKVSAILHLPVLTSQKRIGESIHFIRETGFQISGTLGNSGRVIGGLYLLSNRHNLGMTEIDIIETADDIINRIIKMEDDARDEYFTMSRKELEDNAWRSLGVLLYARRINYIEAVEHFSRIRLGVIMSVIKDYDLKRINDLMVRIQWAHLQEHSGIRFKSIINSDDYRAVFLRDELRKTGVSDV